MLVSGLSTQLITVIAVSKMVIIPFIFRFANYKYTIFRVDIRRGMRLSAFTAILRKGNELKEDFSRQRCLCLVCQGGGDEVDEEGMRVFRSALEFGMELDADEERV